MMSDTLHTSQLDMKEIAPDIFRIRIASFRSFRQLNSYLIRGKGKSLLIDVGYNDPSSHSAFDAALARVGVSWDEISILITHAHADHAGGLEHLWFKGMPVYSSMEDLSQQRERNRNRFSKYLPAFKAFEKNASPATSDLPEKELEAAIYSPRVEAPITTIRDGDRIVIGKYELEIIETPGHDFCEICIWEPNAKIMFSGDHVLESITPSVYVEGFDDELGQFIDSLEKVSHYDAELVLPGHGNEFSDLRPYIRKTTQRHLERVEQVYSIVSSGTEELISIAYAMVDDPRRIPWDKRNTTSQWATMCETVGYLNYLEHRDRVTRSPHEKTYLYRAI